MSHKDRFESVHVWDPNPFNPYGTEVARVIREAVGPDVVHFTRRQRPFAAPHVRLAAILPASTGEGKSKFHALQYLAGLLIFFVRTVTRRPIAVFPWISNRWEAIAIRFLQILKVRTIVVVHNPIPGRDDIDSIKHLRAVRKHADLLIAHTEMLASQLEGRVAVAAHPGYYAWAQSMHRRNASVGRRYSLSHIKESSAVYIGSVRADKGFFDLPRIAEQLDRENIRLIVCVGIYNESDVADLRDLPNVEIIGDGKSYLSDDNLFQVLTHSDVVVAPYREVTVSGSVLLAMTLGLPVVGFECDEFAKFLPADVLVAPSDFAQLSQVAARATEPGDGESPTRQIENLDKASIENWKNAITRLR